MGRTQTWLVWKRAQHLFPFDYNRAPQSFPGDAPAPAVLR